MNVLLETAAEQNIPEGQADDLAAYRNELRKHVEDLDKLGLDGTPNGAA